MTLTSVEFLFFAAGLLVLHWLLPRRATVQNVFLLVASYLFYASWDPRLLLLLLASTGIDYALARGIEARRGTTAARRLLQLSLVWNVGLLVACKYLGFFTESLNTLLGTVGFGTLHVPAVILPLGLSFYTLIKIGYVTDVYFGRVAACRDLPQFALFVAFFPHIIAGPIARSTTLLPQFGRARRLDPAMLAAGAGAILLGAMLKAWVADVLGPVFVDPVFAAPQDFGRIGVAMAVALYPIQVFADFAGYSLLAIGLGRLLGVELDQNFNAPFLSKSLPELWRRWHISLNRWLFEYIYQPLVASAGWFRGRMDLALALVFLASGLWHGARMTFVLWGVLHGVGMIVQRRWDEYYRGMCRVDRKWVARRKTLAYATGAWLLTQSFFWATLIPFRATSLGNAGAVLRGLVAPTGSGTPKLGLYHLLNLMLALGVVAGVHLLATAPGARLRERFLALPAPVRGLAYGLALAFLAIVIPVGASTFIYRNF